MTTPEDLGRRIADARTQRQVSQAELAEAVGMAQSAVSRIESGQRGVDSLELIAIAEFLEVPVVDLLEDRALTRMSVAARSDAGADARLRPALARAQELIDLAQALDGLAVDDPAGLRPQPDIELPSATLDIDWGRELASHLRSLLGIDSRPITDLAKIAEDRFGLDVTIEPLPDGIAGLCIHVDEHSVAMINNSSVPGRQRFTLAHEIAHHLAKDPEPLVVDTYKFSPVAKERRANSFAASFLMPEGGLLEQIAGRPVSDQVVVELQHEFGVSLDALLWQLVNIGRLSREDRDRLSDVGPKTLSLRHGYTGEWDMLQSQIGVSRPPARLVRRSLQAYGLGEIGVGVVARLLRDTDAEGLRRDLEDRGMGPEGSWIDDTVDL